MAIPWKFSARTPGQLIQSADPNNLSDDIRNSKTGVSVALFGSSATAIQNAINTVGAAGGGTVFFPAGTYALAGTQLYIQHSNVTLKFEPGAVITQTGNNVDGIRIGAASDGSFVQVSDIHIEGGSFVGDADGTGSNVACGIVVTRPSGAYANGSGGSSDITIDGIHAEGWTMGVVATGVTGLTVRNSSFTHMWYVSALSAGGYGVITQTCYRVRVENNQFTANSAGDRHAIYIASDSSKGANYLSEDIHILGNWIDWRTPTTVTGFEAAVSLHGHSRSEITGNVIYGGYNGIEFSVPYGSVNNVLVSGNVLVGQLGGAGYAAIKTYYDATYSYDYVTIEGNTIRQTVADVFGALLSAARRSSILGNSISIIPSGGGGAGRAIQVSSSLNTLVSGNNLVGDGGTTVGEYYESNTRVSRTGSTAYNFGTALTRVAPGDAINATAQDPTLITDLTADATPVGSTDYVMTYDASAGALKKVLLDDLPGGGGGGAITRHAEEFTGSATDTFTLAAAPIDAAHVTVFINGIRQSATTDWSLSGPTITTTFTVDIADRVSVEFWTGAAVITRYAEEFTGSATDTFTLAAAPIDADHVTLFINGLRQIPTTDWGLSGDTITTTFTVDAADKISVEYWT